MAVFYKKIASLFKRANLKHFRIDRDAHAILPAVGPYASLGLVYASQSASDATISTSTVLSGILTSSPQKYNHLTFSGSTGTISSASYGVFIWANQITLSSSATSNFNADGAQGSDGRVAGGPACVGGSGGNGATGGGGGGATTFKGVSGGAGGANGLSGSAGATSFNGVGTVSAGSGGTGLGFQWTTDYAWGNGGNGEDGATSGGLHSSGGAGYGGAGGGGGALAGNGGGGGGNGGGGINCIIANTCLGTGTISAQGNTNSSAFGGTGGRGGRSGGGVLWCAFKKYAGGITPNTAGFGSDGAKSLYEITSSNTLVLHTNWADIWDNL